MKKLWEINEEMLLNIKQDLKTLEVFLEKLDLRLPMKIFRGIKAYTGIYKDGMWIGGVIDGTLVVQKIELWVNEETNSLHIKFHI